MSDKVDSTAPLGHSEVASVQHSPRNAIPEFNQPGNESGKISPSFLVEHTGDVFPDDPTRAATVCNLAVSECKVATRVSHAGSQTLDAK
jgi:hypothetical protein